MCERKDSEIIDPWGLLLAPNWVQTAVKELEKDPSKTMSHKGVQWYSLVIERLPNIHEAMGSIPSTAKKKKREEDSVPIFRASKLCSCNPSSTSVAVSVGQMGATLRGISRGLSLGVDVFVTEEPCLHGKPNSSRAEIPVGCILRIRPIKVPNTEGNTWFYFF